MDINQILENTQVLFLQQSHTEVQEWGRAEVDLLTSLRESKLIMLSIFQTSRSWNGESRYGRTFCRFVWILLCRIWPLSSSVWCWCWKNGMNSHAKQSQNNGRLPTFTRESFFGSTYDTKQVDWGLWFSIGRSSHINQMAFSFAESHEPRTEISLIFCTLQVQLGALSYRLQMTTPP